MWKYTGRFRPEFAMEPGPGQESVWDYPRPPRLEEDPRLVEVRHGDLVVASTRNAVRMLETASPPTFYIPPRDVRLEHLIKAAGSSVCEWKGVAGYWSLSGRRGGEPVAWAYPHPVPEYEAIRDYFSFYPARIACFVSGRRVRPQPGRFYGGWITDDVVGPFKGEPGTGSW